jgi:hypothetical protein
MSYHDGHVLVPGKGTCVSFHMLRLVGDEVPVCVQCPFLRSPGQAPYVSRCSQAGFKPKFLRLEGFG